MKIKYFTKFALMFIIMPLFLTTCSSVTPEIVNSRYKYSEDSTYISEELPQSVIKIDNYTTHEYYFKLTLDETTIEVDIYTETINEETGTFFKKKQEKIKCFFVVDKAVNTENYGIKYTYVPIASNFDTNWTVKENFDIISSPTDPISTLTPGFYRVRITTFNAEKYKIFTKISTNNEKPAIIKLME